MMQQEKLVMKLVNVEYTFDNSKVLFYFTADGRIDFRELVKTLASIFHTRIELRQIGVRDKAKMVGGLGICGRPFCCASFLDDFQPVSIKMAKTQNLSLNPTKISGTCGRLMCCLKYEQEAYEDLIKRSPKEESFVDTPDGRGTVVDVDLLRSRVKVRMEDSPETTHIFSNDEIAILRQRDTKPEEFEEYFNFVEEIKSQAEEVSRVIENKSIEVENDRNETAEALKKQIGAVYDHPEPKYVEVKGRCMTQGLPKLITISSKEMIEALAEPTTAILGAICSVIERTPPELVADISRNGIILSGGGSLLWGMDKLITERTEIGCVVADDPESCVALGCGKSLQWISSMQEGTINIARRKLMRE